MRKISKVKNLAGLLDLASIPLYLNGGETVVERTLPEVEVYGDQLRRDMLRTGLTYDELANLNYGAQRQSQIQQREEGVKELAYNAPVTGDVLSLYDVGKDVYAGNYGKAALSAGLFFLPNIFENSLSKILKRNYDKLFPIEHSKLFDDDIKFMLNDVIPRMLLEWDDAVKKRSDKIIKNFGIDELHKLSRNVTDGNFKRLTLEQQKQLTTPEWLKYVFQEDFYNQLLANKQAKEVLNDEHVYDIIYANDDIFDILDEGNKDLNGYYLPDTDQIFVRKSVRYLGTPFHEAHHRINHKISTPIDRWIELPDIYRTINPNYKGSEKVSEMVTTNAQVRREILKRSKANTIEELNEAIDNTSDSKFLSDLLTVNVYGEDYRNYIESLEKSERHSAIQRMKDAAKKYGIYIPALYLTKNLYDSQNLDTWKYSKGGIHIKKENRGKFTKSAKQHGMGVLEYARKVVNDPNATTLQKRRALFAINAKKFKH